MSCEEKYDIGPTGSLRDLPSLERPYEKMDNYGVTSLSDTELLAVILRSGRKGYNVVNVARDLLYDEHGFGGLDRLKMMSEEEIRQCPGIGPVKSRQIRAVIEMSNRLACYTGPDQPSMANPKNAARYIMPRMRDLPSEEIRVLLLDSRHRLIRMATVSKGGLNSAVVNPREIFREAVKANAYAIILTHNHPSGSCDPSPADRKATELVIQAGKIIGVEVSDHIVVAREGWVSLRMTTKIWERFEQ